MNFAETAVGATEPSERRSPPFRPGADPSFDLFLRRAEMRTRSHRLESTSWGLFPHSNLDPRREDGSRGAALGRRPPAWRIAGLPRRFHAGSCYRKFRRPPTHPAGIVRNLIFQLER